MIYANIRKLIRYSINNGLIEPCDELVVRKKYRRKFGDVGAKVSEILKTYPIE